MNLAFPHLRLLQVIERKTLIERNGTLLGPPFFHALIEIFLQKTSVYSAQSEHNFSRFSHLQEQIGMACFPKYRRVASHKGDICRCVPFFVFAIRMSKATEPGLPGAYND